MRVRDRVRQSAFLEDLEFGGVVPGPQGEMGVYSKVGKSIWRPQVTFGRMRTPYLGGLSGRS
jgi:hypothetical protein